MEVNVKMQEVQCEFCGKKIIGWHQKHAEYLLKQHKLIHGKEEEELKELNGMEERKERLSWQDRRKTNLIKV